MISYRIQRMKELRDGLKDRHERAGKLAQLLIRARTPVGTPYSTAKPDYPITHALQNSIKYHPSEDEVQIGTNKFYGPYVHNGTYKNKRGPGPWTEAEAAEWDAIRLWEYGNMPGSDDKRDGNDGVEPRAFLVNGLLAGRQGYRGIYGQEIIGGPPHG